MKIRFLAASALAISLVVAGAASAQPDVRTACAADFQKACPDAKPGPGGGLRECVMTHQSEFSDGCKAALAAMMAARQNGGGAPPPASNSAAPKP